MVHTNLIQIKESVQTACRLSTWIPACVGRVGAGVSSLTRLPAPPEALARWEAAATESARRLDEALRRAGVVEAEGEACAAREAALRERL